MPSNLSIKWKILLIAIAGPVVVALVMTVQQGMQIKETAEEAIIEESRAIVLMAEAIRNNMAKKLELGIMKPFDQIPADKILEAIPVVTSMKVAAQNAEKAGYTFRVPKVSPRNPKNKPTALELEVLNKLKAKDLPEYIVREPNQVRYFRPIKLTKECLYCHGFPKGEKDVVGGTKEGWKVGEIHGAFEIIFTLKKAHAEVARARMTTALWTAVILAFIIAAAWYILNRSIIRPLGAIRGYAGQVAAGDLTARPEGTFSAELGEVKSAIEVMVENLKAKMGEAEAKSAEAEEQARRAQKAMEDAQRQEAKVSGLLDTMARAAKEAEDISNQVASASEELSAQVTQVSKGAEIQDARTGETATAMEEMNATVLEVAKNSSAAAQSADNARTKAEEGARIVKEAVTSIQHVYDQAQRLKSEMSSLGDQAKDITQILEVITDIADQTNLLALNAAIEAARAGEAGRGFAVVADEVRKLAEKTMTATKEVGATIKAIQNGARRNIEEVEASAKATEAATELANRSGEALTEIVGLVNETSDEVRSIATAAEEQSATSEEINRAVEDIRRITAETSAGMVESAEAVTALAELASKLQRVIEGLNTEES